MKGIDKILREAMPIQEEEKASVKPAAKARPILKPSSTSGWYSTPVEQRQWIDIEIQESKDLILFKNQNSLLDCFDIAKKLIDKKMQESITTKLQMNARKNYQAVQDIGQTKW